MIKDEVLKTVLELNKKLLEGISIEELLEVDQERLTDEEYKNRAGDAELFYRSHFKKVLLSLILQELKYLGETAENEQMLLFARGNINAYNKIKNWFEQQMGVINLEKENENQ